MTSLSRILFGTLCAGLAVAAAASSGAAEAGDPTLEALREQNRLLQQQVKGQQQQIDALRSRLDTMQGVNPAAAEPAAPNLQSSRAIRLSGEIGLAYFDSQADGASPNGEFRVDDAKIFLEAPIWKNVYFFTGLELTTREANDEYFHVGELYADIEELWSGGRDRTLSLRVGRFNIPFGEEYQHRGVMADPLITHSVPDIWGIDEGVQAYGQLGRVSYNFAVQNGGHKSLNDFDSDKAFVLRLGFDPVPQVHLSASAMRTGDLTVAGDGMSEVWISNGFFRALSAATTRTFAAQLWEIDAAWRWSRGHLLGLYGQADYEDDSTAADNSRRLEFYSLEAKQAFTARLFGAARYSAFRVPKGYPLAGLGNEGKYFYSPAAPLTTDLDRLSLGLGFQFAPPVVWKIEYSWETGRLVNGAKRDDENQFSSILGLQF